MFQNIEKYYNFELFRYRRVKYKPASAFRYN